MLGYTGLKTLILSSNLSSALINASVIDVKLVENLSIGQVVEIIHSTLLFISSPLGLVSKYNGGLWKIYQLSYSSVQLVNDHNADEISALSYILLQKIFTKVLTAGRHIVLMKQDVKDTFHNIPVVSYM